MEKSLLIILYVVEIVKYSLAYEIFFKERLRRYLMPLAGLLIYVAALIALWNSDLSFLSVLVYFMVLCVIAAMQKTALSDRLQKILILLFTLSCADAFFDSLLKTALHINADIGLESLSESVITFFVVVILFVVHRRNKNLKRRWMPQRLMKPVMVVVLLMALEIVITTTSLEYANKYIENPRFQGFVEILCMLSYLGIEILGILILYIKHVNEEMDKMMENELLLQEVQKQYYESLLEKEENTRRFRHDITNHLLCLSRFAEESNPTALQEYLGKMRQDLQEIQKNCYDSGNHILNIITNHYVKMLSDLTEVRVTGNVQIHIDDMKLCTIYGNLLQNAVEEIKYCSDTSLLEIQFEQGMEFCRISIRNSLSKTSLNKTEKQLLQTDKVDKKNHGIGLLNVSRATEALNGILELKKDESYFLAVVTLPL